MKKTLSVFATLALLFFGAACVPQETNTSETGDKEGNTKTSNAPSVTVGADNISAISVVLKGKANLTNSAASDLQVGFQYSKSAGILPSNSITIEADDSDANYNYSSCVTGLDPATTYYFRSIVRQKGVDSYGETLSFTTKDVASLLETLDATEVEATTATLNAKLDLTDVRCTKIDYGFYCGDTEQELNNKIGGGEIADKSFSATMTDLPHKTQYWYKAYVSLDSQTFYGDKKTFTTDVVPVESVSLDKTKHTFHTIDSTLTLTPTVLPADATDKSVEWTSSNAEVATVDQSGKVTSIGNGTATITITTKDQGRTASCEITVTQWATTISLDQTSISLYEGEEQTLIPVVCPDNTANKLLQWTSLNDAVATVDQTGKVTAVSKGTVTIKTEALDGSGKFATCSVTVKRPVSSIHLYANSIVSVYTGKNITLKAEALPSDASNKEVSWSSSDTSVATVSANGVVAGISRGVATITVMANDGYGASAKCDVEVKQYVTSISLNKTDFSILVGDSMTLSVTSILPDNANDKSFSWSSSDNTVASVDYRGNVIAKSKGNTTIKATATDGSKVSGSCSVIVFEEKVDLGIKTSEGKTLYWASRNLSENGFVDVPEDYGDYYAWGETEPYYSSLNPLTWKDGMSQNWASYSFLDDTGKLTKYNNSNSYGTVDNKMVLDPKDDVAHVKLGGNWRMPTDEEWTALSSQCSKALTTENGVCGLKVTGPNGNSIFLPAAGYLKSGSGFTDAGDRGYYWSSSLYASFPRSAWFWYFRVYKYNVDVSYSYRCDGLSIRPVTE